MDTTALNLMRWAETELKRANIPYAARDAEAIFTDSFGMRREDIYTAKDFGHSAHRLNTFKRHVRLRAFRYPLQYILKKIEFMGLGFLLEEGVFIPRPETEILVERLIEELISKGKRGVNPVRDIKDTTREGKISNGVNPVRDIKDTGRKNGISDGVNPVRDIKDAGRKGSISNGVNVLDMGTGCGNIAISLTKNVTGCKILASDISDNALRVAKKNARLHGVKKDIRFVKSGFFGKIETSYYNYFDVIASNPPYVRRRDLDGLQPELSYEDVTAIDGGEDGLYFYRRILSDGPRYLKKEGIFVFEIGYDQAGDIARLVKRDNRLQAPEVFKDYNGHHRIALIRRRRVGQTDYKRRQKIKGNC